MARGYEDALRTLHSALVFGTNPSLEGVRAMAHALGDPQNTYVCVQVAGTNGKTSTSRMTAAILGAHGFKVGLYTSPELERYPERIEIDSEVVSDEEFSAAIDAAVRAASVALPQGTATEFELLTVGALWLFGERRVDVAILEVGLGGRWDATSVVSPAVAVVTGVALDHMHILGETREKIAAEKAAIIGPASAPVLGPGTAGVEQVFLETAERACTHARAVREQGAPSPVAEELTVRFSLTESPHAPGGFTVVDVHGIHAEYPQLAVRGSSVQADNVATAVAAAEATLGRALDEYATRIALAELRIPGRFEVLRDSPPVVIDAAHNPQAAATLAAAIGDAFGERKPALLLGVLADKDARGIVGQIAPAVGEISVTRSHSERALEPAGLAKIVAEVTGRAPRLFDSIAEALDALLPSAGEGLVISGSITVAGEARAILRQEP